MGIIEQMRWAFEQPGLGAAEKAVLVALAFRANKEGKCWPSVAELGAMTSLDPSSISRIVQRLVKSGLVARKRRFSASTIYSVQFLHSAINAECSNCTESHHLLQRVDTVIAESRSNIPKNKPQNQPTETAPSRVRFVPVVPPEIKPEVATALNEWAQHRKDKKKPITELQWSKLIEEAKAASHHAFVAKVTHSIKQGWQGLFDPPKGQAVNGHPGGTRTYRNPDGTTFEGNQY